MDAAASAVTPAPNPEPSVPRLRKRGRVAPRPATEGDDEGPRRRKWKSAKLQSVVEDLPLELIFAIFANLDPLDLLHLAWTAKFLRRVLMSRTQRWIWQSALAHLPDLPACPPELNEPRWTRLCFYPRCDYCTGPAPDVMWKLRVRCCPGCLPAHFTEISELLPEWPPPPIERDTLLDLLPTWRDGAALYCHADTFNALYAEFVRAVESGTQDALAEEKLHTALSRTMHSRRCELWHRKWTTKRTPSHDDRKPRPSTSTSAAPA